MKTASKANKAHLTRPWFRRWLWPIVVPVSLSVLMLTGGGLTWGQPGGAPPPEAVAADGNSCSIVPNDPLKVVCTLSTTTNEVDIATDILPLAQAFYPEINQQSPVAIQAWGGSGGDGYPNVQGGKGGVAQTVTSLEELENAFGTTEIEYYIGRKADRYIGGGGYGAASTLVAVDDGQPFTPDSLYKILVIAGGGGGASREDGSIRYTGGDGGSAIATIDGAASVSGADGRGTCKGYGGNKDGQGGGGGAACDPTSEEVGKNGIGGVGGSRNGDSRSAWTNGAPQGVRGWGGRSESTNGGAGGGGYGGGGAGGLKGPIASYVGSGGGGGSYARQSTSVPRVPFAEPTKGTQYGDGRVRLVFERSDANPDQTLRALLYFTDGTKILRGELAVPSRYGQPRLTHLTQIIADTGGPDVSHGPLYAPMSDLAADLDGQELYWSTGSAIMRSTLDGKDIEPFLTDLGGFVTGLAIDQKHHYLYWIDRKLGDSSIPLRRVSLDRPSEPQKLCTLDGRFYPWFGVAIDPVSRVLFLTGTGPKGQQTVSRADLAELSTLSGGGMCPTQTIVTGYQPTGVAVDEASGFMAWADTGGRAISIAEQDGSRPVAIARSPTVDPTQNVYQLGVDMATNYTGGADIKVVAWAESSRRIKVTTRTYWAPQWTTYTVVPDINPSGVLLIPQIEGNELQQGSKEPHRGKNSRHSRPFSR